ncbi:bifunctional DNA primase/polymerase [Micromonosporaceae bacterium Da 78-11]
MRSARAAHPDEPRSLAATARAAAALVYASAGIPVLPLYEIRPGGGCACGRATCDRPGKHPRLPRGVHDASTEPARIVRWWRWWPHANVGAATGHVFDVWDIDLPDVTAAGLLAEYLGDLAEVWPRVRTGSGGTHAFVAPTGHGNRAKFLPGCDWRGTAGYVVLPPSRHASGADYAWMVAPQTSGAADPGTKIEGLVFPPAPARLLSTLAPQPLRATPARAWHANRAAPYAEAALQRECQTLAAMGPDSGRNHALNRAAFNLGQLAAAGQLDPGEIGDALAAAAASCGLGEREAARTIASGLTAGQRSPRTIRGRA